MKLEYGINQVGKGEICGVKIPLDSIYTATIEIFTLLNNLTNDEFNFSKDFVVSFVDSFERCYLKGNKTVRFIQNTIIESIECSNNILDIQFDRFKSLRHFKDLDKEMLRNEYNHFIEREF